MKLSATSKTTAENKPRLLDWDTEFWNVRVGAAESVEGLGEWAVENTVGLICLLVDADRPGEAQRAEESGYRFMDVRVTLERATTSCGRGARLARVEELPVLRQIARTAHRNTRFYADPSLPDDRCDDLYEEWIARSFSGWADAVLVSLRDDKPVGYVTVHLDGHSSKIGLIAVDEEARRTGVGQELVSSAVDWAHTQHARSMTVVTQGRNVAAQRLFQRGGFITVGTSIWMHKRYEA